NNQFQQSINIQTSSSSLNSNVDYLDGNLSESFSFQVAPSSIKVTYLGLKGYLLYVLVMGFSNR
ncbi:unnamed protein product, partial [Rotaria sp. Silwood1]